MYPCVLCLWKMPPRAAFPLSRAPSMVSGMIIGDESSELGAPFCPRWRPRTQLGQEALVFEECLLATGGFQRQCLQRHPQQICRHSWKGRVGKGKLVQLWERHDACPEVPCAQKSVLGMKRELADDIIGRNFWTHRLIRSFVNLHVARAVQLLFDFWNKKIL